MKKFVGIDLGTSNSTVSVVSEDAKNIGEEVRSLPIVQLDENRDFIRDKKNLPSAIYYELDKNLVFTGLYAKEVYKRGNKPLQCIKSIKTRIGGESVIEIPYEVEKNKVEEYTVTECSAIFLKTIKKSTEEQINESIESVVVTVPAAFNTDEREAVLNAMKLAGFKERNILDEPTAVLLYEINKKSNDLFAMKNNEKYLIYDIGGGTLDVTIANINKENVANIDILARSPRRNFGGDDFDKYMAAYVLKHFEAVREKIENRAMEDRHRIIARIIANCEESKIIVNKKIKEANGNLKKLKRAFHRPKNFEIIDEMKVEKVKFDKEKLEEIFRNLIEDEDSDLIIPINECLKEAKLKKEEIDNIILTGGSSDFFIVEEALINFFGERIENKLRYVNDEAAVSKGAAIYNYHLHSGAEGIKLNNMKDKLADDIYIKVKGNFKKIISRSAKADDEGEFYIDIVEENQSDIGIFLYYGLNDNPENYTPIEGKYINLIVPKDKGEKLKVKWSMDKDKIIKFVISELDEELVLKNINTLSELEIKNNKINKLEINKYEEV